MQLGLKPLENKLPNKQTNKQTNIILSRTVTMIHGCSVKNNVCLFVVVSNQRFLEESRQIMSLSIDYISWLKRKNTFMLEYYRHLTYKLLSNVIIGVFVLRACTQTHIYSFCCFLLLGNLFSDTERTDKVVVVSHDLKLSRQRAHISFARG